MKVDIFIPCFIDQLYPETGFSMVKVLEKVGVTVEYNKNQTCCGQLSFKEGYWDHAKSIGEKFINDFISSQYVVAPSASCVSMVRKYYDELFYNSALHNEYRLLKKNIFEISDFLINKLNIKDVGATFEHRVTFHDSCTALREYGLKDEPRILLQNVRGLKLIEMENRELCCGFGGFFPIKNDSIADSLVTEKINYALDTKAEYIVSTDASCMMFMQSYISKKKLPLKTIHLVDVLASGYDI
ncbi:MAG: (Fe-S)-binding protein [Omnitrophica WOR_2 bacterium]|jgi:L-lactate dehydrogenase complex protein LldE